MGTFVSKGTVKVTVPERPDEYIEIKVALSQGERNKLMNALMTERGSGTENAERSFLIGTYNQDLAEAAIVGWRIFERDENEEIVLDASGAPKAVPFRRALIADFNPDDVLIDKVLGDIATRYPLGGKKKSDG
jgi:hypothetical protein